MHCLVSVSGLSGKVGVERTAGNYSLNMPVPRVSKFVPGVYGRPFSASAAQACSSDPAYQFIKWFVSCVGWCILAAHGAAHVK